MTEEELSAIEARARAATGGVWRVRHRGGDSELVAYAAKDSDKFTVITDDKQFYPAPMSKANMRAVSYAMGDNGDVLRLVAEVRNMRAALERIASEPPMHNAASSLDRLMWAREAL